MKKLFLLYHLLYFVFVMNNQGIFFNSALYRPIVLSDYGLQSREIEYVVCKMDIHMSLCKVGFFGIVGGNYGAGLCE